MALSDLDLGDNERECMDDCLEAMQACEWCADVLEDCAESCRQIMQAS